MEKKKMARGTKVKITVENGKISCNPWWLLVERGKQVTFDCVDPFAVHFHRESPFPQKSYHGKVSKATGAIPRNKLLYWRYKYFVAVYEKKRGLTADPDIIIVP